MEKTVFDLIDPGLTKTSTEKQPETKTVFDLVESVPDKTTSPPQPESKDLTEEEIEEDKPESWLDYGARTAARLATRVAEVPVETAKGIATGISKLPISPTTIPKAGFKYLYEKISGSPMGEEAQKSMDKYLGAATSPATMLPEKEEMREFEKKHTGQYLQPQSDVEKMGDEAAQDITSLMLPTPGSAPAKLMSRLYRSSAIAGAGQVAKKGTEMAGFDESTQDYAKLGTMFISSLLSPRGASKHVSEMYQSAESKLPPLSRGDARPLQNDLNKIVRKVERGTVSPGESKYLGEAKTILDKIKDGRMTYAEAVASKRSLNLKSSNLYKDIELADADQRIARNGYNDVRSALNDFISTAEKKHPEFLKEYREADKAYGAIANSKWISDWIAKKTGILSEAGVKPAIAAFFAIDPGKAMKVGTGAAAVAVGGKAAITTGEVIYQVLKNKTLRNYYLNVLNAAAKEDAALLVKNMKTFETKAMEDPEVAKFLEEYNEQG